jgi:hypothetical protein
MEKKSSYSPGWDEARVQRVLAHYEEQTEEEAVAEDEAAFETIKEVTSIDVDLLTEIIAAVEEWAGRQGLTLAPHKEAELIGTLYSHFLEVGRKVDKKTVGRVCLKLVA